MFAFCVNFWRYTGIKKDVRKKLLLFAEERTSVPDKQCFCCIQLSHDDVTVNQHEQPQDH